MNNLPEELIEIIHDYTVGTSNYWKKEYDYIMEDYDDKCIVYDQDIPQMKFRNYVFVRRGYKGVTNDRFTPTPGYYKVNDVDFDFLIYWNKGIIHDINKYHDFEYEKREWRNNGLCRGTLDQQGFVWAEDDEED